MFPWGAGEGSSRGFPRRQNLVVAVSWMVRAQSPWEEKRSSWKEDDDLRQERKGPSIRKTLRKAISSWWSLGCIYSRNTKFSGCWKGLYLTSGVYQFFHNASTKDLNKKEDGCRSPPSPPTHSQGEQDTYYLVGGHAQKKE